MDRRALMDVARGRAPADLVVKGGRLVCVHTSQVYPADVAVKGDRIAAVGDIHGAVGPETRVVDAGGAYVAPGFIDTHQHSYESHLSMTEYARLLLWHGTTAVSEAFYGMGLVAGTPGVKFCLEELKATPLRVLFLVPTLAYLQNRELGLPTTPKTPGLEELFEMLRWPECVGLEEPPCVPIIEKDPGFLDLFEQALEMGKAITGHACGISGPGLQAYRLMGAASDHECTTGLEAREKARLGMSISMREGSGASDVVNVSRAVTDLKVDPRCFTFCGDEVEFLRIHKLGHLDYNLRLAVGEGVEPVRAVAMATINAAQLLRVDRDLGSISPGKLADIVLLDDLRDFRVRGVLVGGRPVVEDGRFVADLKPPRYPEFMYQTLKLKRPLQLEDFAIPAPPGARLARVRVIGVTDGSLISDEREAWLKVQDGVVKADPEQDVLKVAMVDRYDRWDRVGLGFIQGFNLKRGAIGSTYNPLYENIVSVGADDREMLAASEAIASRGGGFVAVEGGRVVAALGLPLFGLLSDEPLEAAVAKMEQVYSAVRDMGCKLKKGPFHTLAFMCACGEIGHLKICHEGLFNVEQRRVVDTVLEWK